MQGNTITIPVDLLNNGTTTNEVYTRFEEAANRSSYIGANHALDAKDTVTLYRTQPKASGNFKGVGKSAFKFSKDVVVTGVDGADVVSSCICEISFSLPVGLTPAETLVIRQRALALLDLDAVMAPLNDQLMI